MSWTESIPIWSRLAEVKAEIATGTCNSVWDRFSAVTTTSPTEVVVSAALGVAF
jgi:hypothetical protein